MEVYMENQYVVIYLDGGLFALDIGKVESVVKYTKPNRVPFAKDYIKGLINLRGEILPVMSLKNRIGIKNANESNDSRIIVIKPENGEQIGFICDKVLGVEIIKDDDIDKLAVDTSNENARFFHGIGKLQNENLVSILNIENIVKD